MISNINFVNVNLKASDRGNPIYLELHWEQWKRVGGAIFAVFRRSKGRLKKPQNLRADSKLKAKICARLNPEHNHTPQLDPKDQQ